jgi:hypothetical protein
MKPRIQLRKFKTITFRHLVNKTGCLLFLAKEVKNLTTKGGKQ